MRYKPKVPDGRPRWPRWVGGPDRVRTDDLLDANQALSQLSYGPNIQKIWNPTLKERLEASLKTGWIVPSLSPKQMRALTIADNPKVVRFSLERR